MDIRREKLIIFSSVCNRLDDVTFGRVGFFLFCSYNDMLTETLFISYMVLERIGGEK